jgi:SAM-dependent methyltransferase
MSKQGLVDSPGSAQPRDHHDYVTDPQFAAEYAAYQAKYSDNPKECDKRTAQLVLQSLQSTQPSSSRPRILDIGCSTGNFLRHLKHLNINADLIGGDLMESHLEVSRKNPALSGISFETMDIFKLPTNQPFDIITANAVTMFFPTELLGLAMQSVARALRPGGCFIAYDFASPYPVDTQIIETSAWHPNGVTFWMRSRATMALKLQEAGFDHIAIEPFEMPIDLPKPMPGSRAEATLETFTIKEQGSGRRMMFRGVLHQPWAHILARKST